MRKHYSLRVVALAGVCLAPLAAAAQTFDLGGGASAGDEPKEYNNEIDIGARYQSSNSPLFGRYTGNDARGFSSLGGIHLEGAATTLGGKTINYELTGTNLDFGADHHGPNNALAPESEVNASLGQQGTWKVNGYYDAITYTGNSFYTPYTSSGTLTSALAARSSSFTAAQVAAGEVQTTAGTRRDIGGGDAKYIIGDWTVTSGLRHEHKEGTKIETAYSVAPFAEPVNYDTDKYSVQGQYATRRLQAILGYEYSKFTDNNSFFSAPYVTSTAYTAQYSLPNDNDAHYVTGRLGYNITPTTRLATNFQYGMEMSNVGLTTGTYTTPAAAVSSYAKNPGSVGLLARTYNGNVTLTSRPIDKLDVKVSYGLNGRENGNSPSSFYGAARPDSASPVLYTIRQQSWTKQKAAFEAGYHILPSTKLTLGYAFDSVARDAGDAVNVATTSSSQIGYWVGHSSENTATAKLSNNSIRDVTSSVAYEHGVRTGTFEYVYASTALNQYGGSFYQAPRTSDRVKMRSDYTPNEEWTIGANGKYETNAYHYPAAAAHPSVNLPATARDYNASIGPDVTFSPTKAVSTHLFYNFEQIYYANRGQGTTAYTSNGYYGYSATTTDSVHTVGLSGDWHATDRLKLGADYTFSYGDIGYNMYDGIFTGTTAQAQSNLSLPTVSSSMHSFKLHGEYQLTDNISLLAGYGFDFYKDNDWAYSYAAVLSASSYTSGETQNHYAVHSVYTAMHLKF